MNEDARQTNESAEMLARTAIVLTPGALFVGSGSAGGVDGHADEPKREAARDRRSRLGYGPMSPLYRGVAASVHARGFAAERERRQRLEPARAGFEPGTALPLPAVT